MQSCNEPGSSMLQNKIQTLIQPSIEALGYELWGCEYLPQGRHSVLRIYIDKPEGIDITDCEAVSHQVSAVLDVDDPISGQYHLEVSSPGIPRPLFCQAHYVRYIGQHIQIKLIRPVLNCRQWTGKLVAVQDDGIVMKAEHQPEQLFLFSTIIKAFVLDECV